MQREPILKILPDPTRQERNVGNWTKLGYLPIFEKENAFDLLDQYDQIGIVDSDIYIKESAPNIFEQLPIEYDFGGVVERSIPTNPKYVNKISKYSKAAFEKLQDVNWEWNLEASMAGLGIDCNRAHVQPFGAYHYHGTPSLYLENLDNDLSSKTLIGYAADGFLIYYDPTKTSSYQIKSGGRPGDGISAPCGDYDGLYTADYEYVNGLGDLGECNEYYDGVKYYYVLTDSYPGIPRCFIGTPSNDFRIGPGN